MADSDVLEIPIEIRAHDSEEIRKLLSEIDAAEEKLRSVKTKKGTRQKELPSTGSGAPIKYDGTEQDTRGGVFSKFQPDDVLPINFKPKDVTSRQPMQRENEFKRLRAEVERQKQQQNIIKQEQQKTRKMIEPLDLLLGGALLGQPSAGKILGGGKALLGGGAGMIIGVLGDVIKKIIPYLGPALIAWGIIELIIDALIQPGAPFDRRWRREMSKELANLTERQEKQSIAQGLRAIRIAPYSSIRDEAPSINLANLRNGRMIYNQHIELLVKHI